MPGQELTEVSLHMGGIDDPLSGSSWMPSHAHAHAHGPGCGCRAGHKSVEKKASRDIDTDPQQKRL